MDGTPFGEPVAARRAPFDPEQPPQTFERGRERSAVRLWLCFLVAVNIRAQQHRGAVEQHHLLAAPVAEQSVREAVDVREGVRALREKRPPSYTATGE